MKWIVLLLLLALCVIHQDFWWWSDRRLVMGFMPIGLAWHVLISIGAAGVWWLAVAFCWPHGIDEIEESGEGDGEKVTEQQ